jgi:hypothetical protein
MVRIEALWRQGGDRFYRGRWYATPEETVTGRQVRREPLNPGHNSKNLPVRIHKVEGLAVHARLHVALCTFKTLCKIDV